MKEGAKSPPAPTAGTTVRAHAEPATDAAGLSNMTLARLGRGGDVPYITEYVRRGAGFAGAPVDNQESNRARRQAVAMASRPEATGRPTAVVVPPAVRTVLSSANGAPLPDAERWAARMGSDVSGARVVTGSAAADAAAAIGARAFTVGNRVFMGAGNDASTDGGDLLAHELTHVAQQRGSTAPGTWDQLPILDEDDPREVAARARAIAATGPAEPAIARDPAPELEPAAYRQKYADKIGDGIDAFVAESKLVVGSQFISVPGPPALANQILGGLTGAALDAQLDELLTPAKVETAIEKGRVHGRVLVKTDDKDPGRPADTSAGPDRWYADVAVELGALMIRAMQDSLVRLVPRYINAAVALALAEEAKHQRTDLATAVTVTPSDVVASTPLDVLVIGNALARGTFDYNRYRAANPDEKGALSELHEVTLTWRPPLENTFWVRATRVDDPKQLATVEDVAYALFGTPTATARLAVVSPPLFGFSGGADLLPQWQGQLQSMGVTDFDKVGYPEDVAKYDGPLHEEMAKSQGATVETKALTKMDVLRLLDDSTQILGSIDTLGAVYGMGVDSDVPGSAAVRAKILERHGAIASGSEEDAFGWAGHAQGQRDVLTEASFAMQTHAKRHADMTKFEKDAAAKAGGFSLPQFVRLALHRVASEFANAVAMSDLPATAAQMLANAEDDAGQLPIEFADGMLAAIQRQIDDASDNKRKEGGEHDSYDIDGMRAREEKLKVRLARIRELLQSSPEAASKELAAIQKDLSELGAESQMVAEMDQIDAAWQALDNAISFFASDGTNDALRRLKRRGDALHRTWKFLYDGYKSGADKKSILDQLQSFRDKGDLSVWLGDVRYTIHDAQVESMIGKFAALIVITIVTDGLGDIVLAGAEGWGLSSGAAAVVAGGAEAAVFTTLSQIFLDDDHGLGHIALDFVGNWVMFGAMRRFAMFAKTAELTKFATITGQTVLMAGMTFARAELDRLVQDGRLLTRGEVAQIAVQGVIQAIAMHAIAPTVKEHLFGDLENSAYTWATRLRANNANLEALKIQLETLKGAKDLAAAQTYIANERAWVQERMALLDEIATAAASEKPGTKNGLQMRLKLTPEQIRGMRGALDTALGGLDDATVMANLTPKGPGMYSCPASELDAVIHAMKGEIIGTTTVDGARTVDVKLPDGSVVKVTDTVDGALEWLDGFRANLSAEQLKLLDALSQGKTPREVFLLFKGDADYARDILDLARIRTGEPGTVRGEGQLSNADVAKSMNAQLQNLGAADVERVINTFPADQQVQAREVLARASGFGKMESFNQLRAALARTTTAGKKLYTPGRGSLADNVLYLASKNTFKANPGPITATPTLDGSTVVILDNVVIERMQSDPVFAADLKAAVDAGAVLVQPRGFTEGFNMFNATTPEAVQAKTAALLERANVLQAASGGKLTFGDAVTAALDERARAALANANVDTSVAGRLEIVDPASVADMSSAALADQLGSSANITENDVGNVLQGLSASDQALLRELLAHQAEIFSPRRQAIELQKQAEMLLDVAKQKGVPENQLAKKVYYYIFLPEKSYGMLALAHQEVTGTPTDHYIEGPNQLKALVASGELGPDTVLIILDDVAGSGDSLKQATMSAKGTKYKGEVVVSPMVTTGAAKDLFLGTPATATKAAKPGVVNQYSNVTYAPGAPASALKESAWFKSLSQSQQQHLLKLLGYSGFGENALSMAFPYMAPDNNNAFFADMIAKAFIMNQNAAASKNLGDSWKPPRKR